MLRNFVIAFAIVIVGGVGAYATSASALTTDEIQAQVARLMQQITELTGQIDRLRGQAPATATSVAETPPSYLPPRAHRICAILARDLAQGTRGDDVLGLQEFLRDLGFLTVEPTGFFGQLTAAAVKRWQAQEGVSAIGRFGPLSRERLMRWCRGGGAEFGDNLSARPTRGEAPLSVTFYTKISGFRPQNVWYMLEYGDGTSERATECFAPADACVSAGTNTHTYTQNGAYTATLVKTEDPCGGNPLCMAPISRQVIGKVQIRVGPVMCTREYMPVCGSKPIVCITTPCNPIPTTYSNKCEMEADGARLLYEGQCRTSYTNPADDPMCKAWTDGVACGGMHCGRDVPGGTPSCAIGQCYPVGPQPVAVPRCTLWFDNSSNRPPVISSFSGPTTLAEDATGTWTIQASDPENGSLSYSVAWGDEFNPPAPMYGAVDSALWSQTTTFTHAYARPGEYRITITVRDSAGQTAQTTTTVRVIGNIICTEEYAPVCATPPGCVPCNAPQGVACAAICQLYPAKTYTNSCYANVDNATVIHSGRCNTN